MNHRLRPGEPNHSEADPDRPEFHFSTDHQPNHHHILRYLECSRCNDECPKGTKPRDFQKFECGWTRDGFQVWCTRHESNIIHIDFCGLKVYGDKTDCRDDKHIHDPYDKNRTPICDCEVKQAYEAQFEEPVEA